MYKLLYPEILYSDWCKRRKFIFPIDSKLNISTDLPFDIRRVHPLKQANILDIYTIFKKHSVVRDAWIIGSSVRPTCDYNSDIDIIVGTSVRSNIYTEELKICLADLSKLCLEIDLIRLEDLGVNDFIFYETLTGLKII